MKLLITTCGSGGGNSGPDGIFEYFQSFLGNTFQVFNCKTYPNKIGINVGYLLRLIDESIHYGFKEIYLCGWSMGGATVIQAAYYANTTYNPNPVKGIILFATQGAKTDLINKIDIPILFIHGKNDSVLSFNISEKMHNNYKYNKKILLLNGFGHNFKNNKINNQEFARYVVNEIVVFFNIDYSCPM